MPSFDPMSGSTSVPGSSETRNLRWYQAAMVSSSFCSTSPPFRE